jgi:hypothetical protein
VRGEGLDGEILVGRQHGVCGTDAGGQIDERGIIGVYCGTLALRGAHQGPDAARYGLNDGHIETLKNAGYVTVRKITGLAGVYVTSGQMMSEGGSGYSLVERRRVMEKARRQIRAAQLFYLNDVVKVGAGRRTDCPCGKGGL